jgi:hypothetical protein
MTRHQALNLVSIYDGEYPEKFINLYLDYYQISQSEFDEILDKFVNRGVYTDSQCLGAYYVLGALTIVSEEAAASLPWLYQSML